jgi:hypothetical protein
MPSASISAAESTPAADIAANAQSFARLLPRANKSPDTIKAYLDAVARLDAFLEAHGMPRAVASIHREHLEALVVDQLARLKQLKKLLATTAGQRFAGAFDPGGRRVANPMGDGNRDAYRHQRRRGPSESRRRGTA